MGKSIDFDLQKAHQYFSADCFNQTWDLIDKANRSEEENLAMVLSSMASLWHWTMRGDVTQTNLSIGYWQLARVYTLLQEVENARKFALLCLKVSQKEGVAPFYLGFAYEALARLESLAGNKDKAQEYLALGRKTSGEVVDEEERKMLLKDLDTI